MSKVFQVGDKIKTNRDMDRFYFFKFKAGEKAREIVIPIGSLGKVIDVHIEGGKPYDYICIDFTASNNKGSWYVHKDDVDLI